ncbi:MAG: peptidylprolyl isomerase [Anaerolineae bacterium]|nr:peptidylprolyl isomerase [Anaerolineae bacterium]
MALLRTVAMLTLLVILAACSTESSGESAPTQDPANVGLVARVNGIGITEADFQREFERRQVGSNAASMEALQAQVLETLIRQELISQSAPSLDVVVTDADIQAEYDNLRTLSPDDEAWAQFLETNNYTEEEMQIAQRDVLLTQRVQAALMADYLGDVEQVNARHIVVQTREEAESILERLNNGEGFASLAAEQSFDITTREIGGNLGWFARNELFYTNLEEIAFSLEVGEIAGPIPTLLGFHVIQTLDKAVRPIEAERLPMLSESIFGNWLATQTENATIERYR